MIGHGDGYEIVRVRWPAFADVYGEGLLLEPVGREPVANVIAHAALRCCAEQICGLAPGIPSAAQMSRRLAEAGCRVVIPALIDRRMNARGISHREWLHRAAYEMGRTLTGYEVNGTLAVVDWLESSSTAPIGLIGWGDGGLIAWYATAVDTRIDGLCISGTFGDLEQIWQQPLDRMVFGLLERFADAELAVAGGSAHRWSSKPARRQSTANTGVTARTALPMRSDNPPALQWTRRASAPGSWSRTSSTTPGRR